MESFKQPSAWSKLKDAVDKMRPTKISDKADKRKITKLKRGF